MIKCVCVCRTVPACEVGSQYWTAYVRMAYYYFIMKGICDDMNKKIKTPEVEQLFKGMLCLKSVEECYEFFEDICTINELLSLSQRFEVARMLREKKTYLEIAEKTGASTATISRVNRSLNYGNDGYDMVLDRLNEE
jgi:TrpR-related protein YerC/YecD